MGLMHTPMVRTLLVANLLALLASYWWSWSYNI